MSILAIEFQKIRNNSKCKLIKGKEMKVNPKEYAYFDYPEYLSEKVENPNPPFSLGDIVYNRIHNSIGVVLGCIDYWGEELRTDMDGMQSFQDLEIASSKHLRIKDVVIGEKLKTELSNNFN